jgi:transcriptional regulator with XRE-family HTH domain
MGLKRQLKGVTHVLTGSQVRAARGLLNVSVSELAEQTGLAVNTIKRAESTNGPVPITAANANLLMSTFEKAGVTFIKPSKLGPGVRLTSPLPAPVRARRRDGSRTEDDA